MILFKAMIRLDNHAIKKNTHRIRFNGRTNRRFIGNSSTVLTAQKYLENRLFYIHKDIYGGKTITEFINCKLIFYYPYEKYYTKKGKVSMNLADLSNLYELPQDALQKAKVIKDDWQIVGHDGSTRALSFDENYHLEIRQYPN